MGSNHRNKQRIKITYLKFNIMKKLTLLVINLCLIVFITCAQAPQTFNYQAIIRNSTGDVISSQDVNIRISILLGNASGTSEYVEFHQLITNPYGLVNLEVGSGTVISGSFTGITWGASEHYLKIEVDITGGTDYVPMGTVQLISVPYALYANEVSTVSPTDLYHWNTAFGWGNHALAGYLTTEADGSATNEGLLTVGTGGVNSSEIQSNTLSSSIILAGGTNVTITEDGNTITIGTSSSGDVTKVGIPENDQLGIWTGDGTIEGDVDLTFNGEKLSTKKLCILSPTAGTKDYNKFLVLDYSGSEVKTRTGSQLLSDIEAEPALTKGTLTEVIPGLEFSDYFQVIGNDITLSLSNGYSIPTLSQQATWSTAYNWGDHALVGYLTSYTETDPIYSLSAASTIEASDITNWDAAYSWGDHHTAGYWTTAAINDLTDGKSDASNVYLGNGSGTFDDGNNYNVGLGIDALKSNTSGIRNTALGYQALNHNSSGGYNTATGAWALMGNTTGEYNTSTGALALTMNTTGSSNTATGLYALRDNLTGGDNTATGAQTLSFNTTGHGNTANGSSSLWFNTIGQYNTGSGFYSLVYNTTGGYNASFGAWSSGKNTTGTVNTAAGYMANSNNQEGSYNTMMGGYAGNGSSVHNKSNNVMIGYMSGYNATTGTDGNIFLGYMAGYNETGANKLYIENSSSSTPLIYGEFDNDKVTINDVLKLTPRTTAPASPTAGEIYVGTDGHIYCYLGGAWKQLDN
jgi:hypothetical protein